MKWFFIWPDWTTMGHAPNFEQIIISREWLGLRGLHWGSCIAVPGKGVRMTLPGLYYYEFIPGAMAKICFSEPYGLS